MAVVAYRPSVKYQHKLFVIALAILVVSLAASIALGVAIGADAGGAQGAWTGAVIAVLANALWFVPTALLIPAYYRSLHYEIQEDRAIVRVGVITRSHKLVPFRTVTNLKMSRGPFDRLFGIGTLHIETAGLSGQKGAEVSLVGLPDVVTVYDEVAEALRRFRGAMAPTQAEEELLPSASEVLAAILDEVRAIRRLLERA